MVEQPAVNRLVVGSSPTCRVFTLSLAELTLRSGADDILVHIHMGRLVDLGQNNSGRETRAEPGAACVPA